MTGTKERRDALSRSAARQLLWLGAAGTLAFAGLLALLGWAASVTGGGAVAGDAIDFEAKAITTSIRSDAPQLDSSRSSDVTSNMILSHALEGLLRYDGHGGIEPGVAERWDVGTDSATFYLRDNARWSDGQPVTAHDFVFAWQTAVDPATASRYAFIFYFIKNAEAINNGEMDRSELGARAVSDRVLEVEYENPLTFFEKIVPFFTFSPIREDFYLSRNGRYGADAEDLLFNGPFKITRWVHGASIRLEKNPAYWNADAVKLNAIEFAYITNDASARLNLFQDGRAVDVDYLPAESLEPILKQRFPLGQFSDGSVWYLQINHRPGRPTSNYHLRRALQLVNDRDELVNKVLKMPSYKVARSFFPAWLKGEERSFIEEYPPRESTIDVAEARRELELAKRELGLDVISLVLLCDDLPVGVKLSEYLQGYLKRTLGLDIKVDRQIFGQRLEKAFAGDFDIALFGWSPDYDDPMTFADLLASWNLNNYGRYNNPELDEQVRIAQRSVDQRVRMQAFGRIQDILFDDAVILPFYERSVLYAQDQRLRGVIRQRLGPYLDYSKAYLVESP